MRGSVEAKGDNVNNYRGYGDHKHQAMMLLSLEQLRDRAKRFNVPAYGTKCEIISRIRSKLCI